MDFFDSITSLHHPNVYSDEWLSRAISGFFLMIQGLLLLGNAIRDAGAADASQGSSDIFTQGFLLFSLTDSWFWFQFRNKEGLAPEIKEFGFICWKTETCHFSCARAAFEKSFSDQKASRVPQQKAGILWCTVFSILYASGKDIILS